MFRRSVYFCLLCALWLCIPTAAPAQLPEGRLKILYEANFETGDFMQFRRNSAAVPNFAAVLDQFEPPPPFGGMGNGEHLHLLSRDGRDSSRDTGSRFGGPTAIGPVRHGNYAARFRLHNRAGGGELQRDPLADGPRRRVRQHVLWASDQYRMLQEGRSTYVTVSTFVPADWDLSRFDGWGPSFFENKQRGDMGSPCFAVLLENGGWKVFHRWEEHSIQNPSRIPWQKQMFYTADYPAAQGGDGGEDLRADFPDQAAAQAALARVNRGGWTDWVYRVTPDARGSAAGGRGRLELWKRDVLEHGPQPWVKLLDIRPRRITRGSGGSAMSFDRGVWYNSSHGYFYGSIGLYSHSDQILDAAVDREVVIDCYGFYCGESDFELVVQRAFGDPPTTVEPLDQAP